MDKDSYKSVLLLKNQLETYVYGSQFEVQLTFSFFLNQYIRRQKLNMCPSVHVIRMRIGQVKQFRENYIRILLFQLPGH